MSTSRMRRPSTSSSVSIASRVVPGHLGDDHALAAEEGVDERGLADVRAPDDREPDEVLLVLARASSSGGSSSTSRSSRSPVPRPWRGRHGHRLAEPEAVEVVRERQVARRVDLVRGHHDRHVAAAQDVGDLLVAGPQPGAGVDDEQRDLGVGQRGARLVADRDRQRVLVVEVHAAGVDQRERRARSSPSRAPCGRA